MTQKRVEVERHLDPLSHALRRDGEVAEHRALVRRAVVLVLARLELEGERLGAREGDAREVLGEALGAVEAVAVHRRLVVDHERVGAGCERQRFVAAQADGTDAG